MIVTLGSVRGAPGVTSWSLLLAAAWPGSGRDRVVLEADPDGGVIGARYGFGVEPGAISLAASLRRADASALDIREHGRSIASNVVVVPSPETPERATAVWSDAAATVAEALSFDRERVWFVDAGRLRPNAPTEPFMAHSRLALLFTLANTEDLVQLPGAVARLSRSGATRVGVVIVGKPAHDLHEIGAVLGTDQVWTVPASRNLPAETAAVFGARAGRRSWLWRSALGVASEMAAHTLVDGLREVNA